MINKNALRWIVLGGLVIGALLFLLPRLGAQQGAQAISPPGFTFATNGEGGRYLVKLQQGTLPAQAQGTVRTDTNCTPDARGYSHCRNQIVLATGKSALVETTHIMDRYPCFVPGQTVSLAHQSGPWYWVSLPS